MLVLTRKSQESVVVGGSNGFERMLKVTVLDIIGGKVRLGFDVDKEVPVHRWEVWERIQKAGSAPTVPGSQQERIHAMLSSYPIACPHAGCGWKGNVVPSNLRGGADAEIVSMHRAWFQCPRCQHDWEVRINGDQVVVLPVTEASSPTDGIGAGPPARGSALREGVQTEDYWRDDGGEA